MPLDFDHPPADPVPQVLSWLSQAGGTGLNNPNAAILATVDPGGGPSARTVLIKGLDAGGAVFFTNRNSRKGHALEAGSQAALLLYWDALHRQICLEGPVSRTTDEESDAYFARRPRGAQIGAWASRQSEPLPDRPELDRRVEEATRRYEGGPVPRPPHWGGYRLHLRRIEFWQGREDRLHDRIAYTRGDEAGAWRVQRLYP